MSARTRITAYALIAGALGVLLTLGVISGSQHDSLLGLADAAVNLVAAIWLIVAARHITPDSWSTARHAIYLVVAAILATLAVLGFWDAGQSPLWLSVTDQVLSLASIALFGTAIAKVPANTPGQGVE